MKRTIAIVAGGDSSEHDVSLRSAQGIYSFMDKEKYDCYIVDLERDGWTVGGLDYSKTLIETAASVLHTDDLTYSPASGLSVEPCYDCLLSNSVFSYFPDHEYAEIVLDKMCRKANYAVILFDIHDVGKKDDFIAYRRSIIEDYEERYRDLGKLFYDRSFFEKAASRNNMSIEFIEYSMNGYWNNEFVFNLIMYKNNQEKCNMAG